MFVMLGIVGLAFLFGIFSFFLIGCLEEDSIVALLSSNLIKLELLRGPMSMWVAVRIVDISFSFFSNTVC